jgi:hypothetical protein
MTYTVHSGTQRQRSETFKSFGGALHCYKIRAVSSVDGASITNDDRCDEDCDGLTDEEIEALEVAEVVVSRWKRLRRRAADRLVETAVAKFKADPWSTEELEAGAALEMARKRDERLVEWAMDRAFTVAFPGVPWAGRSA